MAAKTPLPCTIVLHDDAASAHDVLGGARVLPVGSLSRLSSPGAKPLLVKASAAARNAHEVSIHRSLAIRYGFENRTLGAVELVEDEAGTTATHVEFFFKDQHLSRADMWRIMQRLNGTVATPGQRINYLGSFSCEIRTIYIAGREVSSAYVAPALTRPIFRSASARYTLIIQISKEMLEQWQDGQLMYERVIFGFLPELFGRWEAQNVKHQITVLLCGRTFDGDFFHVVTADMACKRWRKLLRLLRIAFNSTSLPRQVSLAASGNILEAIHVAAMEFAKHNVDPRLSSRGQSIIAVTAGAGVSQTSHELLQQTTQLLMGNSIGVDIVALSPQPLHPVPLFSYRRNGDLEFALPHWVDISFWPADNRAQRSCWLLPEVNFSTDTVAIGLLDRLAAQDIKPDTLMDYDDGLFASSATEGSGMGATATSNGSSTTVIDGDALVAKVKSRTSEDQQSVRETEESMFAQVPPVRAESAALPPPIKRVPSETMMSVGRKISLGPKGLAIGRGLASTTISTAHAEVVKAEIDAPSVTQSDRPAPGIATVMERLAKRPSQWSLATQFPAAAAGLPTEPTKPISIQQQFALHEAKRNSSDPTSDIERAVLAGGSGSDVALEAGRAQISGKEADLFFAAVQAAEEEGSWNASPWLTLLNPSNPTRENMRVAAQYRKWQHVFPKAVSSSDFKWTSMCTPAALPLTIEYKPSSRELERHFSKAIRRLNIPSSNAHKNGDAGDVLAELMKLRLIHGFQIAVADLSHPLKMRLPSRGRVVMSLGNIHHELQILSESEVQIAEYTLQLGNDSSLSDEARSLRYNAVIKGCFKGRLAEMSLNSERVQPEWSKLDEQVLAHTDTNAAVGAFQMRLILIPFELPRMSLATPGSARGISDDERRIEGIQALTQFWQRNRYVTPAGQRYHTSVDHPRATPRLRGRDPNPLAVEYQTRDTSAVVNDYGPLLTGHPNGDESYPPLFSESELYHSSNFDVARLVKQMQEAPPHGVEVRDRRWLARTHFKCFRGDEMVNWLLRVFKDLQTREDAINVGNELLNRGVFSHVRGKHGFRDGNYFYQISSAHRTTEYPDHASIFAKTSMRSVPGTPMHENKSSPLMKPARGDAPSSGRPTPTMGPSVRKQLWLSQSLLYNVDPSGRSDQDEVVTLHYDRIHNPENCYHIQLEWVNATAILVRDSIFRWSGLAESHGLRLVQMPLAEACHLQTQHALDQLTPIKLALKPPSTTASTPVLGGFAPAFRPLEDPVAYYKALLRKLGFVLDFEAAASFTAQLDVLYSYDKPEYDMTQFVHRSGLVLVQISASPEADFLAVPNRLGMIKFSTASRSVTSQESAKDIITNLIRFCKNTDGLRAFYEEVGNAQAAPSSPWSPEALGLDNDVPPISLPPRLAHRAAMKNV